MIDVLLPFFGDPLLMRMALESVLHQTQPPDRVIVVDDCYPDRAICEWLASLDDPRLTYVRNAENLGANKNYSKALAMSSAEYVVFMGADDLMRPDFIAHSTALLSRHPQCQVLQCGVDVIDETGAPRAALTDRIKTRARPRASTTRELAGERLASSLLRANWTYFPSLVWRREAIAEIGFRSFSVVQDLALLIDVVRSGGTMVLDDRRTFAYRRHLGSDSGVKTAAGTRFAEEAAFFSDVASDLTSQGWHTAARASRLHLTSRLHAAALLPQAARGRDASAVVRLARHALR